ncbi:MAG: hypothetical protein WBM39_04000, partial [Parasphingorhabdus sp.]
MSFTFALLITALAPSAVSATAASNSAVESQFISVFTAICLENMGDPKGQETAATQPPLAFSRGSNSDEGLEEYLSGPFRLGINAEGQQCALTYELGEESSLDSVIATMSEAIGTDQGQQLEEADSRYWLIAGPADQEYVLAIKVAGKG